MKKIVYITACLLCLAVLGMGCKNTLTPSEVDVKAALAETISDGKNVTTKFEENGVNLNVAEIKESVLSLNFTLPVDGETASKAITVGKLSASSDDNTPYVSTPLATTFKVINTVVHVTFDLTDVDSIEIAVNAEHLRALNGQKLDTDNDFYQGETPDDDLYMYFKINGDYPDKGCQRINRRTFSFTSNFAISTKGTSTDTLEIVVSAGVGDEDIKALLDGNIQVQSYARDSKKWTTISSTASTYDTDTRTYVRTFAAQAEGTLLRLYVEDVQKLVTSKTLFGFTAKYTNDGRKKAEVLSLSGGAKLYAALATDSTIMNKADQKNFGGGPNIQIIEYSASMYEYLIEELFITFDAGDFVAREYGVGPDVKYNGIDKDTFTNDNVMFSLTIDGKEYFFDFDEVYFYAKDAMHVVVNTSVYSKTFTTDPTLKIYAGPGLKTLPGTNSAKETVSAFSFGDPTADFGKETEGFYQVF